MEENISKNISLAIKHSGLTRKQVAGFLNIKVSEVARIEKGTLEPTLEQMEKIANLFCMEQYDFLQKAIEDKFVGNKGMFKYKKFSKEDLDSISGFVNNHKLKQCGLQYT